MKSFLVLTVFIASQFAVAAPAKTLKYIAKNKQVLVKIQPGKKAVFEKLKVAGEENPPEPQPPIEPIRYGKLKTVIKKSVVDMTQPDPIWREEVVCTIEADMPVYQFDDGNIGTVQIPETICPMTLNGKTGELHVAANILLNQFSGQPPNKTFSSWFYFLPATNNNDDPTFFAGDSGSALTKQMDLKDLTFGLGYGYTSCVIAQPIEPKPRPRLLGDSIGTSPDCGFDETIYGEFEMVDSQ